MTTLEQIRTYNPWWLDKKNIEKDKHVREYEGSRIQWTPQLKKELNLAEDAVYSIRGPRQVGKTTLIKLLTKDLLQKTDAKKIMYYSCDMTTEKELKDILETYLAWIRTQTQERVHIFLDEISAVKEWQKPIKVLYDMGKLEKTTLILTGSHTIDIKKTAELLPGRRGKIEKPDKVLLPLNFREYVNLLKPELTEKKMTELEPLTGDLNRLLDQYLVTGGFPKIINSYTQNLEIEEYLYQDYVNWIIGDFRKLGKNDHYLKEIVRALIETMSTPVGWETIQKKTDIGSVNTVHEYINDLKHSFIVEYLLCLDISKRTPEYLKNKKIYIRDPFIYHSLKTLIYNTTFDEMLKSIASTEEKSKLIEAVVCDHISRQSESVYYWKSKRDKEVDFVVLNKEPTAIEVKYTEGKRHTPTGLMKFRKGLVLTKNEFNLTKTHPRIPVAVFLLRSRELTGIPSARL